MSRSKPNPPPPHSHREYTHTFTTQRTRCECAHSAAVETWRSRRERSASAHPGSCPLSALLCFERRCAAEATTAETHRTQRRRRKKCGQGGRAQPRCSGASAQVAADDAYAQPSRMHARHEHHRPERAARGTTSDAESSLARLISHSPAFPMGEETEVQSHAVRALRGAASSPRPRASLGREAAHTAKRAPQSDQGALTACARAIASPRSRRAA